MRLIDADALIQDMIDKRISFNADVNEAILNARTISNYEEYVNRVWETAYKRGKEEASQWIPCSERLPEKWGDYLVAIKWEGVESGNFYTETNMAVYDDRAKEWDCDDVIAWMPLPEYKEEDNG